MYIYVSCVVFFVSYNNVEVAFTSLTRSCLWRNLWQAGAVPPLDWHQWHLMAMGICRKELDQDVYIYIYYILYWNIGKMGPRRICLILIYCILKMESF